MKTADDMIRDLDAASLREKLTLEQYRDRLVEYRDALNERIQGLNEEID